MTYADVEKKLTTMLQTPDTALAALPDLLKEIKADYESIVSLTSKVESQDNRIRDLQDTNMKLFLAQTGQVANKEEDDDDDVEGPDAIDAFVSKLNKEE